MGNNRSKHDFLNLLPDLYRRLAAKNRITHIFYHDVVEESPLPETKLFVELNYFWQHIEEIRKRYSIISMSEILETNPLPKYPLVLSFDGYSSRYVSLAKDLSDRNIKALFYLQTEPILTGRPHWHQQLYFMLRSLRDVRIEIKSGNGAFYHQLTDNHRENIYRSGRLFKFIEASEDEHGIIDFIASRYEINIKEFDMNFRPLSPKEVATLAAYRGIEVGSHSHTHPNLKNLTSHQILNELSLSKELLEKLSHKNVVHFCYPEGYVSNQVVKILKKTGYLTATTTRRALHKLNSSPESQYLIPRFCAPNGPFHLLSKDLLRLDRFYRHLRILK